MRQTIIFEATAFNYSPVEIEIPEGEEPDDMPDAEDLPSAVMIFQSGPNFAVTVPVARTAAEQLMQAFTEAEPNRPQMPESARWQPSPAGVPAGMLWEIGVEVIEFQVAPPHQVEAGLVPHWTLIFGDADGGQIQVAVSDAMSTQVVRVLAQIAAGELTDGS